MNASGLFHTVHHHHCERSKENHPEDQTISLFPGSLPPSPGKANVSDLSPLIKAIINHSLQSDQVPLIFQTAMIRPHLKKKKPSLDPEVMANYCLISNHPFLSKVLENVVSGQLQDHLKKQSV